MWKKDIEYPFYDMEPSCTMYLTQSINQSASQVADNVITQQKDQQIDIPSVFSHDKVKWYTRLMGFLSTYACFLCFTLVQNL